MSLGVERDASARRTLLAAGFLRAAATSLAGIVLGLWLAEQQLSASTAGLVDKPFERHA